MKCPQCRAENADGARFCGGCGTALATACASCSAENPLANRFCSRCGAVLDATSGELKQVTLLFCDIVDSTGLAERLGPEAMHDLLRLFLDTALAEVYRYGGTAPQFLGDGFMALFGAPQAHEDHVRRALLAALAIRDAVRANARQAEERDRPAPDMRIGIHTGLVVFGAVATNTRMDHTAIGDAANVAARLQQAAQPGVILISDETRRLAQGHAEVEPAGWLRLKGKAEAVSGYRLLGYSHRPGPHDDATSARIREFVGRDDELVSLTDSARQIKAGRGRAIGLVGEPGIGKSRLLAEFRQRLRAEDINWIDGHCVSYGTGIPYLLVLDLLRSMCGIAEGAPQDEVTEKLRLGLQRVGIDADDAGPLLLNLFGVDGVGAASAGPSPEVLKARTLEILCRLVIESSWHQPLILTVEDLHWIDKPSEEALASIIDKLSDAPILIAAAYRPEYRPPWLDGPNYTEIPLQPLDPQGSLRVVHSVLGGKPDADPLTTAIVNKADGNPMFLEQLALQTAEDGGGQPPDAVPGTIRDVVMARIDRLPDDTKRLLQTAAVIGREFPARLLDAVRPGRGPLEAQLRELTRLEFIHERADSGGSAFVFRHVLTQETAYSSLLARYRRNHHAAIGRALERLHAGRIDEATELLAFHFGRSEIADKAVDYAILAAEKAQRRWANAEALANFAAALERLGSMPDTAANRLRRADAVLKQAEIRYALGQYAEHLKALGEVRGLVKEAGDARRLATWHYWTGFLHGLVGGRPEVAIEHCRAAARIASAAGLEDLDAFAAACLAQVYIVAGRLHEAVKAGERALASFEARGDLWWASRTLWLLSIAANYLGEWEMSLRHCQRALDHGIVLGDLRLKAVSWARMGSAYIHQGDIEQGMRCCEEALSLEPIERDAAWARAVRGYGAIRSDWVDAGIGQLTEALSWFAGSRMRYTYLVVATWLAEGHLRRGERDTARGLIEDVLKTSQRMGYLHYEGRARMLMAEAVSIEAPGEAVGHAEAALHIFELVGARNDLAKALVTLATLRQRNGEVAMARQLLEQGFSIFEKLGTLGEPARVQALMTTLDDRLQPQIPAVDRS